MDGSKKITGIVFAAIIALAITACKVQSPGYVGLYIDNLSSVNDTIEPGESPLMLDTASNHMVNSTSFIEAELPVYLLPAEEIIKISSDSVNQLEVEKLLTALTDSIQLLDYKINELRKQPAVMPDTSFTGEKPQEFQPQTNQQTDILTQQQLMAMDDQIQILKNRLIAMQNAAARTPQQTTVTSEPAKVQSLNNQQTDQRNLLRFQNQNDTIQFLRSQLRNLQLQPQKRDSVYIEKEVKEMQPAKELVDEQKSFDSFRELQNTIQLLKNRVLSLEKQTLSGNETSALTVQDKIEAPDTAITELIVAFYGQGEIKPRKEESVLKQIKELYGNKKVTKITLSGFTDSSGNAVINEAITTKRLNYLSEKMISWISKEKIFFQNFGDTFASDPMVNDERRVEIRIYTK